MTHEHQLKTKTSSYITAGILVMLSVLLDQWTKHLAVLHLKGQRPVILIDQVFQLCYLENRGAAFGLFQNQRVVFLVNTVIILTVILYFYGRLLGEIGRAHV